MMSTELAKAPLVGLAGERARTAVRRPTRPGTIPHGDKSAVEVLPLLCAAVALHLVTIGFMGGRPPAQFQRPARSETPPAPEVRMVEDVHLEQPPPEQPQTNPPKDDELAAPTVPPLANIAVPPIAKIEPIAAVSATTPVAFGLAVTGPVRLVADAAQASGGMGARRATPAVISLDTNVSAARNLLLPHLEYPQPALERGESGSVLVEFRTSATGEIIDMRVRKSSGSAVLDKAALANLRRGRWSGPPGTYLKTFDFRLG